MERELGTIISFAPLREGKYHSSLLRDSALFCLCMNQHTWDGYPCPTQTRRLTVAQAYQWAEHCLRLSIV